MTTMDDYLDKIVSQFKILNETHTQIIFLLALDDFFNKTIDGKTLAGIAIRLFYVYNDPFKVNTQFDNDLQKILSYATDYSYFLTKNQESTKPPEVEEEEKRMEEPLRKYFEENKHLLKILKTVQ